LAAPRAPLAQPANLDQAATQGTTALPDLILWGPSAQPSVVTRSFDPADCQVSEGCATPGTRRLLEFNTESRNLGPGNLVLGNPANNPLFTFDPCHGHFHLNGFAEYRLRDGNGVVVVGDKVGFCLLDSIRFDPNASPSPLFNCSFQGIQAGWGDVYSKGLPCQYIDVTDVPAGDYTLEMIVNPDGVLLEAETSNNAITLPVTISAPPMPPPNDHFADAIAIDGLSGSTSGTNLGATKEPGEPNHAANNAGGASVWWSWTAPASGTAQFNTFGSNFDTLLAVYTGAALDALNLVTSNDDAGTGLQSRVTFDAARSTTYKIAVDGFGGDTGQITLNWTLDAVISPSAVRRAWRLYD